VLKITVLPARQGDALWIRWGERFTHQMFIDMGTEEVGLQIRNRLLKLPPKDRRLEVLVVTHMDRDHIGGVLTCLAEAEPIEGLEIGDVWFNGWTHLNGGKVVSSGKKTKLEAMGAAQGERLTSWLLNQRWNRAFGGRQVSRRKKLQVVELEGDLSVTVLGPTRERLGALVPVWKEEVENALRTGRLERASEGLAPGLERFGPREKPALETDVDLNALADSATTPDSNQANGTSIVLLIEYKGRRVLLAADAFGDDLVDALNASNINRIKIDAIKTPHHGSARNVTDELVRKVNCPLWLFSTDGTQFRHPDASAIARVLRAENGKTVLGFNVPSTYNKWWDDREWKNQFRYQTRYGTAQNGLTVRLSAH
jgi:beta-lactamase superfamily II metal-dependent hydrolase